MLKEVKAVPSMCRFVIMYGLFCHRASEADWFNLQIAMPHSLEELKTPQLQTFQQSSLFFYHYKGSHRGGSCLVLFFQKQSWGGAYISLIFRENQFTVGQRVPFVSLRWSVHPSEG